MATVPDSTFASDSDSAPGEDIKELMAQKAHEMFALCDREQKGFITMRDMQRLQGELPLSGDQLEDVFDSLDADSNGYLTLAEFTGGFGTFLGLTPRGGGGGAGTATAGDSAAAAQTPKALMAERVYENAHAPELDEQHFQELMDELGAADLFEDMDTPRAVWLRLRRDQPELLESFEDFLVRISGELRRSHTDVQSLETALRSKSSAHDEEVLRLIEETEQQMRLDKERLLQEEKIRERQTREMLEREVREKDRQVQELLLQHEQMEERLQQLNSQDAETKQENEKLQKERDTLESQLDSLHCHLQESREHISDLKTRQRSDKRDRAMAALQISEGIALERSSLVKQLEMLREMNRKLRDERDESELRRVSPACWPYYAPPRMQGPAPNLSNTASQLTSSRPSQSGTKEESQKHSTPSAPPKYFYYNPAMVPGPHSAAFPYRMYYPPPYYSPHAGVYPSETMVSPKVRGPDHGQVIGYHR